MRLEDIRNIGVVGAGIMGHGIAQTFALAGYAVRLNDVSKDVLSRAAGQIRANLDLFVETGLISPEDRDATLRNITCEVDLASAVGGCDFVVEAVPEVMELKKQLFMKLDAVAPPHAVLATNTSSLSGSAMAQVTGRPDKVVVTHWFNPPHLVPLVEVVRGSRTSDETLFLARDLMIRIGKKPVVLQKEVPGFVANRIQSAIMREALAILGQGVAGAAEIDLAIKAGPGFRLPSLGIFEIADLGGLDTWARASAAMSKSGSPDPVLAEKVARGDLGVKSGKGFYDYTGRDVRKIIEKRDREFIRRLKEIDY